MFRGARISLSLIPALLLGSAFAAAAGAQGTHRAAQGSYTNKKAGYHLSYPKGWTKQAGSGQDLELLSPDNLALFTAKGVKGTATAAAIRAQQRSVLLGFGVSRGPIAASVKVVNGVPYQYAEIIAKTKKGNTVDVLLLDTVKNGYLYDFEGFVQLKKAASTAEAAKLVKTFNSITLR